MALLGKGNDKAVSTSSSNYPAWLEQIMQQGSEQAWDMSQNVDPATRIASFSPDQNAAMDYTRNLTNTVFNPNTPSLTAYQGASDLMQHATTNASRAAQEAAQGAQTTGADIQKYMDPYNNAVVDTTLQGMRDSYDQAASGLGSKYAAAQSFGGSREAVSRANMANDYVKDRAATEAGLRSAAYQNAAGMAEANNARELQGNLQGANLSLQGMGTAANQYLQGLSGQEAAFGNMTDRMLRGTTALGGVGDAVQAMEQRKLDLPYDTASWFRQFLPSGYPMSTTTTQPTYNNGGGLVGGALTAASLFL